MHAVLFLGALALLNGSTYAFHVAASRLLGPAEYGELAALLAVLMVLSVPLGVVQTIVATRAARTGDSAGHEAPASELAVAATRAFLPVSMLAALIVAAGAPALESLLRSGFLPTLLLAPYTLLALVGAVPLGILQGRLRFAALATAMTVGVVVRLGVGVPLVAAGFGVAGALAAVVLAQAATLGSALVLVRIPIHGWRGTPGSTQSFSREVVPTMVALGSFWLLAELDIVLARHYLDEDAAGLYSSAGLVARGVLVVVAAIGVVALPRFVTAAARGEEAIRWLRMTLATVAVLAAVGGGALVGARELLIPLAFGAEYEAATGLLPVLALGASMLALANVLMYFHIALETRAYLFVAAGAVAEAALAARFHEDGRELAVIALCVTSAVVVMQLHAAIAAARWRPRFAGPVGGDGLAQAPSVDVSVVLPCHNAGSGLRLVLDGIASALRDVPHEVIVVSDGSTDDTVAVARAAREHVRVLQYGRRVGKGHALRVGLGNAHGRYVAFLDGDGDLDPESLRAFVTLMSLYQPDIVLGSKRHPLSEVRYPPLRRLLSWGYHRLARLMFRVNVRDTQTGLKLIRRDVLAAVLPRMLEKRFAFDLELVVVARVLGYTRLFEAPIRLEYRFSSRVDPQATLRILVDTLAIFYRRYVLGTYGAPVRSRPRFETTQLVVTASEPVPALGGIGRR
jgi:O-antigen/teichoic acid export membrane protein